MDRPWTNLDGQQLGSGREGQQRARLDGERGEQDRSASGVGGQLAQRL